MIAHGSLGEIETFLLFAKDLGYIDEKVYGVLDNQRQEIRRLLRGLINSLK
jgi:four helix bundle protein